jgi:hypothetical protein
MPCSIAFLTKLNPWTVSRGIFKISTTCITTKFILRNFRVPWLGTVVLLRLRMRSSARQASWECKIVWAFGGATFLQTAAISYFFTSVRTLCGFWAPPWFPDSNFFRSGVVSTTPRTTLRVVLPGAYAPASIALHVIRTRKQYHCWMAITWAYTENIPYKCCYVHGYGQYC